jgi:hypothetical protein
MHLQVCGREEKGGNTRARSLARLASSGRAGPGAARAHDVRVNSLLKSGPKPHRPASSFCRLFCYESVPNMF